MKTYPLHPPRTFVRVYSILNTEIATSIHNCTKYTVKERCNKNSDLVWIQIQRIHTQVFNSIFEYIK